MKNEYRPINACFKKSSKIRASHKLYEDFTRERNDVAKFYFYLWLHDNELKAIRGKDKNGDLGYNLQYIPKP